MSTKITHRQLQKHYAEYGYIYDQAQIEDIHKRLYSKKKKGDHTLPKLTRNTKLRKALELRKWSQTDLFRVIAAQAITPLAKYMISRITNGKTTNYNAETLMKLCKALDVTPNDLLERENYDYLWKKKKKK